MSENMPRTEEVAKLGIHQYLPNRYKNEKQRNKLSLDFWEKHRDNAIAKKAEAEGETDPDPMPVNDEPDDETQKNETVKPEDGVIDREIKTNYKAESTIEDRKNFIIENELTKFIPEKYSVEEVCLIFNDKDWGDFIKKAFLKKEEIKRKAIKEKQEKETATQETENKLVPLVFDRNVSHNGTRYKKGDPCKPNHIEECLKFLVNKE